MDERLGELADRVAGIEDQIGELVMDALRAQMGDAVSALHAKSLERELAKVRRSLTKAEVILRHLASG